MALILTIGIVGLLIIIAQMQTSRRKKNQQELFESLQTMDLEEIIPIYHTKEDSWIYWNEKWANKMVRGKDSGAEYRYREEADLEIKEIRKTLKERFPNVILDTEKLKIKAHAVATPSEKKELKALERKRETRLNAIRESGIIGPLLLENTHSPLLRGAAATLVSGPIAGGIVSTATEAKNKEISRRNMEIKSQSATRKYNMDNFKEVDDELINMYTEIVQNYDEDTIILLRHYG